MSKKQMSKSSTRKRSNKAAVQTINMEQNLIPVSQEEANMFQQLIQMSNQYGKLKQQKAEYDVVLKSMKDKRKQVATGKVTSLMLPFGKNKFYPCDDKKMLLKELDAEISILSNATKGITGQVNQFKEGLIGQGLRINAWSNEKFGAFKPENTYSKGCNPKKEETILFEGELDSDLKIAQAKEAVKEAKKRNCKGNCNTCKANKK